MTFTEARMVRKLRHLGEDFLTHQRQQRTVRLSVAVIKNCNVKIPSSQSKLVMTAFQ